MLRNVLTLLLAGWTFNVGAQTQSAELKARIERIENGLLEPVVVSGAPIRRMRLTERMRELRVPGVSIAVINGGVVEWTGAYGVADAKTGRPVTTGTQFRVGSISKPIAAAVTMRLASSGKADLDEDVNRRLRRWHISYENPSAQRPVTARSLLSHTAGMPQFDLRGYDRAETKPTLLQVLSGSPPSANPPAKVKISSDIEYGYSSLGYAVLEQYLLDATSRPFDALGREVVFNPLGMHDTMYAQSLPPDLAVRAALGHELSGAPVSGGWRESPELAASGLWSTASDLARFAIAMQQAALGLDGTFLTKPQAVTMLTPVRSEYGLGFELDHKGAEPTFHHSGSVIGYKALLFAYTRTGQGAIVLTNGDYGWSLIEEVMRSIATEYGWEDYRPVVRDSTEANTANFERLVGNFSVSNVTIQISRKDDRLFIVGPPIGPFPAELIPAGDYDYFLREKNITLKFDPNGAAPIETLTMVDRRPRQGKRIPAVARNEIKEGNLP